MYLFMLNKNEQKDFLEIAKYSIGLDGKYTKEEEEMLAGYMYECQLVDYIAYRQNDIEKIIAILRASTKKIKRIILIELMGIFLADGEMCEKESAFLYKLAEEFNIKDNELKRIIRWVEAMNDIVAEGYELISK